MPIGLMNLMPGFILAVEVEGASWPLSPSMGSVRLTLSKSVHCSSNRVTNIRMQRPYKYRRATPTFKDKFAEFIVELNTVDADVYTAIYLAATAPQRSHLQRTTAPNKPQRLKGACTKRIPPENQELCLLQGPFPLLLLFSSGLPQLYFLLLGFRFVDCSSPSEEPFRTERHCPPPPRLLQLLVLVGSHGTLQRALLGAPRSIAVYASASTALSSTINSANLSLNVGVTRLYLEATTEALSFIAAVAMGSSAFLS